MKIIPNTQSIKDYLVELRRYFHMYPEESLKEFNTSNKIKEELNKLGIKFHSSGETGVIGIIEGNSPGKTVALRADMDALCLLENKNKPYSSKNNGYMHGCGHDGHVAMLLGAAKILNEVKDSFNGKIKLIFQPGEEIGEGAKKIIENGDLDDVDAIIGIHLWNLVPVGKIALKSGPLMASSDYFKIIVKGKGGHGSSPHETIDPIVCASSIVMDVQTIVSRENNPLDPLVVTVGKLIGGSAFNIIPNEVIIEGTCRYFSKSVGVKAENLMKKISSNTATSFGANTEFIYKNILPPTINDENIINILRSSLEKTHGNDSIIKAEKTMGSEDMSFYLEKVPGAMVFVGSRNDDKGITYPHHNPNFDIDEDSLPIGTSVYVNFALDYLSL